MTVFILLQRIGQNWAEKLIFWVIFRGFSLTPSYALRFAPQFLRQMKGLMKIHIRGKFHRYSICGSQVIKFQMFSWRCSIHKMAHFGGFWDNNFPQTCQILLKLGPEVEYYEKKTVHQQCLKMMALRGNGTYPKFTVLVLFWAQFTPGKSKIMPKTNILPETISLRLSNETSRKSHINHTILI